MTTPPKIQTIFQKGVTPTLKIQIDGGKRWGVPAPLPLPQNPDFVGGGGVKAKAGKYGQTKPLFTFARPPPRGRGRGGKTQSVTLQILTKLTPPFHEQT